MPRPAPESRFHVRYKPGSLPRSVHMLGLSNWGWCGDVLIGSVHTHSPETRSLWACKDLGSTPSTAQYPTTPKNSRSDPGVTSQQWHPSTTACAPPKQRISELSLLSGCKAKSSRPMIPLAFSCPTHSGWVPEELSWGLTGQQFLAQK